MIKIDLPVSKEDIRKLKVEDVILLNGLIVTARDRAHKYMVEERPDDIRKMLRGSIIYHCGPVMKTNPDGSYSVVAAGPTTSIREEPYQADVIHEYDICGVIGKGGMGDKTLKSLQDDGAVYLHAVGGASQVLAKSIVKTVGVHKLEEFGTPEAFWQFEVKDFPVIVTMDSHGGSLHKKIDKIAIDAYKKLVEQL
ncbi:MAG: FumA C-terminus/TtdB family hydratase beta subunit [Nitrospinota bacterium]